MPFLKNRQNQAGEGPSITLCNCLATGAEVLFSRGDPNRTWRFPSDSGKRGSQSALDTALPL